MSWGQVAENPAAAALRIAGGQVDLDPPLLPAPATTPELSASQWKTYSECARKWAWKYLHGLPDPSGISAQVGLRVHKILEDYLKTGAPINGLEVLELLDPRTQRMVRYLPGQVAQATTHLLPPPGFAIVEEGFTYQTDATKWRGFMDVQGLIRTPEPGGPILWLPSTHPVVDAVEAAVLDHKATSDLKWAKTQQDLREDIQANIYAGVTMQRFGKSRAYLQWNYVTMRGRSQSRPTSIWRTKTEVEEFMGTVADPVARQIQQLYKLRPKAKELPANTAACESYGGCPFRAHCNLGMKERMEAQVAKETIDEIIARKKAARGQLENSGAPLLPGVTVPPQAPVQAQAPALPQLPPLPPALPTQPVGYWKPGDPENPAQAYLRGQGKPLSVIASAADMPPPDHIRLAYDAGGMTERGIINPPEAPAAAPPSPAYMPPVPQAPAQAPVLPAPAPVASVQQMAPGAGDNLDALTRDQLKDVAVARGLMTTSSRHGADAIKDMLRKSGVTHVEGFPSPAAPTIPTQAPALPAPAPIRFQTPQVGSVGFVLHINCRSTPPKSLEVVESIDLITSAVEKLREDGVQDYRLVEYGKGPAMLCALVEDYVLALSPDVVILDAHTPEGLCIQSTLERLAAAVIRGF